MFRICSVTQGIAHDMYKQRIGPNGKPLGEKGAEVIGKIDNIEILPDNYCGSCYGAETVFREYDKFESIHYLNMRLINPLFKFCMKML